MSTERYNRIKRLIGELKEEIILKQAYINFCVEYVETLNTYKELDDITIQEMILNMRYQHE